MPSFKTTLDNLLHTSDPARGCSSKFASSCDLFTILKALAASDTPPETPDGDPLPQTQTQSQTPSSQDVSGARFAGTNAPKKSAKSQHYHSAKSHPPPHPRSPKIRSHRRPLPPRPLLRLTILGQATSRRLPRLWKSLATSQRCMLVKSQNACWLKPRAVFSSE